MIDLLAQGALHLVARRLVAHANIFFLTISRNKSSFQGNSYTRQSAGSSGKSLATPVNSSALVVDCWRIHVHPKLEGVVVSGVGRKQMFQT
jgi:hypothetical protein